MKSLKNRGAWLAPVLALSLVGAACGDDGSTSTSPAATTPGATAAPKLSGTINLDGSSTVGPLTEVAAELFMKENSGVRVAVAISGTSGGFVKFCKGETDGNSASRPIKQSEIDECAKNNIKYEAVQVANDALGLVVNANHPINCITTAQAKQIWDKDTTVSRWGDVTGLTLPDDAKGQSIRLFGPGTDSGTFDLFTEVIMGKSGQITNKYVDIGEDDQAGIRAVESDRWAMSYIPYSYVQEAGKSVKALQIDSGSGCVDATLENVQNGKYSPLGRPLFLYASDKALARPETVAFFEFFNKNQKMIAETAVFVPMNDTQVVKAKADVDSLK